MKYVDCIYKVDKLERLDLHLTDGIMLARSDFLHHALPLAAQLLVLQVGKSNVWFYFLTTIWCCKYMKFSGEAAVVAGWGRTSNANNILPEMLWQVTKPLMAHATCQSYYTRTITPR